MKQIKKPARSKGAHITPPPEPPDFNKNPPVFSLEKLTSGKYCFSAMVKDDKASFAEAIFRRKGSSWIDIQKMDRHGLGTEKIARSSITAAIPPFITDDVDSFLAFRFNGLKPMVGYRNRDIFYVLWFDHDFTLYPHK